jgi:hypothetical protein
MAGEEGVREVSVYEASGECCLVDGLVRGGAPNVYGDGAGHTAGAHVWFGGGGGRRRWMDPPLTVAAPRSLLATRYSLLALALALALPSRTHSHAYKQACWTLQSPPYWQTYCTSPPSCS